MVDTNKLKAQPGVVPDKMRASVEAWLLADANRLTAAPAAQDRAVMYKTSINGSPVLDVNGDGYVTLGDAYAVKMIAVGGGEARNVTTDGFDDMLLRFNNVALKCDILRIDGTEKKVDMAEINEYADQY